MASMDLLDLGFDSVEVRGEGQERGGETWLLYRVECPLELYRGASGVLVGTSK